MRPSAPQPPNPTPPSTSCNHHVTPRSSPPHDAARRALPTPCFCALRCRRARSRQSVLSPSPPPSSSSPSADSIAASSSSSRCLRCRLSFHLLAQTLHWCTVRPIPPTAARAHVQKRVEKLLLHAFFTTHAALSVRDQEQSDPRCRAPVDCRLIYQGRCGQPTAPRSARAACPVG